MSEIIYSKPFKIAALLIAFFLVALISFAGGMAVGFHKAKFSFRWGANYERNFMGPPMRGPFGFFPKMMGRGFRNANGLAGKIISITDDKLVIKDRDSKENTVKVTKKTIIKDRGEDLKINELKKDDTVVVLGNPSDKGVIEADLIRIFPLKPWPRW